MAVLQYEEAASLLSKAISLNPHSTMLHKNRGYAYFCNDQFASAIPDFERALTLKSEEPENIYFLLGISYKQELKYKEAF